MVAVVLAVGGAAKLLAPHPTASALAALGLPSRRGVVLVMGAGEVAVGAWAATMGGRHAAAVVAAAYLAFAGFVVAARRSGAVASCGCFGQAETPPSLLHLVVNLVAAGVAAAAAVADVAGLGDQIGSGPLAGVPFVVLVATGVYGIHALLTVVPAVLAQTGPAPAPAIQTFALVESGSR